MVAVDVDENVLKKELKFVIQKFLDSPGNKEVINIASNMDNHYGGLSSRGYVNPILERGLNCLSSIYQYGVHEDDHPAFSNSKIIEYAKEVLAELKTID